MVKSLFTIFFRYLTWRTLKRTFINTIKTRLLGLASEIAFNTMLSLFPAILALLTALGLFAESLQETFREMAQELSQVVPQEAWVLIRNFAIQEIANSKNSSLFSLSFLIAVWTASGAISTAMTAFDLIQQIPPGKMRSFWHAKLVSLGLTIGSILSLLLASLLVLISDFIGERVVNIHNFPLSMLDIWRVLLWPISLSMVVIGFAFAYRYGPSISQPNTPIIPGATIAAIFWAILSALFRLYVQNFGTYNKVYGAVGTVIVLMLWLWMSAFVFLVGYQLNVIVGEDIRSKNIKIVRYTLDKS
jgi:membrane protein